MLGQNKGYYSNHSFLLLLYLIILTKITQSIKSLLLN